MKYGLISFILIIFILIIFIIRCILSLNKINKLDKLVKEKYKEINKLHHKRINVILKIIKECNVDGDDNKEIIKVTNILLKNKNVSKDIEYNIILLNKFKVFLEHNYDILSKDKSFNNYLMKIKDIDKELKKYIFFYNESVNIYNNYYDKFNIILKLFNKESYRCYK